MHEGEWADAAVGELAPEKTTSGLDALMEQRGCDSALAAHVRIRPLGAEEAKAAFADRPSLEKYFGPKTGR
jgi:hypothetical protein